ncbi:unnamed protein product [Cuscuta europaea]|uniref:Prolamin-like domain-containing protein n=1 Tax=Cuscuta europaea TaxID=41803 RepID=A0A9P0ZIW1_CUSEU|nr:unnamed protein product [Cuscuta europaea]
MFMPREIKMSRLSISFVLLLGILLSGKLRFSLCDATLKCSKPEPNDKCWKLLIQYVQADRNDGRVPPPTSPFPDCCPDVRNLGEECFWYWVDHENGKLGYHNYDVEVVYFRTIDAWSSCQEMPSLTNV